jgi:hypothetical protein
VTLLNVVFFFQFPRGDEGGGAGEGQGAGGERGETHDGGRECILYSEYSPGHTVHYYKDIKSEILRT